MTSVGLRRLVPAVMACVQWLFLLDPLRPGNPSCPFDGLTFPTASPLHSSDALWCRNLIPACHRLRLQRPRLRSRLTLGRLALPRNPQASGVDGSHIHYATHSGIRSCARSTSPCGLASPPHTTLPYHVPLSRVDIQSFGTMLEPRYVVGAR